MSTFICAICGAPFTGTLAEASEAAFRHSGEHAGPVGKTCPRVASQAVEPTEAGERFSPLGIRQFSAQAVTQ